VSITAQYKRDDVVVRDQSQSVYRRDPVYEGTKLDPPGIRTLLPELTEYPFWLKPEYPLTVPVMGTRPLFAAGGAANIPVCGETGPVQLWTPGAGFIKSA